LAEALLENRRRLAVRRSGVVNGIDYVEVVDGPSPGLPKLEVRFFHPLPGQEGAVPAQGPALAASNLDLESDASAPQVRIAGPPQSEGNVLRVAVDRRGNGLPYRLRIVSGPGALDPPAGFDRVLSQATFTFDPSRVEERDASARALDTEETGPPIDYLAKDYASFRRAMLDRLSSTLLAWTERNPADVGVAIVELLAYAADQLSYRQDAVATEAYLTTARRRSSVRRHARLLDYPMHDGCNARAWVCFQVAGDHHLHRGAQVLSRLPAEASAALRVVDGLPGLATASGPGTAGSGPEVFETMEDAELRAAHNRIRFHTWGEQVAVLPPGSTSATLRDDPARPLQIQEGDVLVLEEVLGPATGLAGDADPAHRYAVRLTTVRRTTDELGDPERPGEPVPLLEVAWAAEDALPSSLWLAVVLDDGEGSLQAVRDVSVARGNVVLADHGRRVEGEAVEPPEAPPQGTYRPRLQAPHVTSRAPLTQADLASAGSMRTQDPVAALPEVLLVVDGELWTPRRDLLECDGSACAFVVEVEEHGTAFLRFGDGAHGRRLPPGARPLASYRAGKASAGNVGAEALAHVVLPAPLPDCPRCKPLAKEDFLGVRNPLPAAGGTDPEPAEVARLLAPQAFRGQQRVVTAGDHARLAEEDPDVQGARATPRWTGSWSKVIVSVDPRRGAEVDEALRQRLRARLEQRRVTGQEVEVRGPAWAPIDIALAVHVRPGHLRADVERALEREFSAGADGDGRRGFFHPDNFTFGQPVFLNGILARAMEVPGVAWVDVGEQETPTNRFRRWGQPARGELAASRIDIGPLEIARCDSDPRAPERGRIAFFVEGGL
jgi:hypothetical protein